MIERTPEANARRYPWYAALYSAFFWMPIFFLFFAEFVSLGRVLTLEAIYYAGVVCLEVPSGYVSDAVGRRGTLAVSALSLT
ncbi:MAG: MFS transporter, partial [Bradymonadaceae bacterium]